MPDAAPVNSRNIPEPIKREVRQRCGFGCVLCGLPLYEYEHMLGWANVKQHVPDEITLLCDQHHKERTNGWLPIEDVARHNDNPFNLRSGVSAPYALHYSAGEVKVTIGSNEFKYAPEVGGRMAPVMIDGFAPIVFAFEQGHVLLSVVLFDEHNQAVLHVEDNQLIYSVHQWDVQLVGRNLILRHGEGDILIDLLFEPPGGIRFQRGRLLYNGVEFLVHPDYLWCSNGVGLIAHNWVSGPHGIVVGPSDVRPRGLYMPRVSHVGRNPRKGHAAARAAVAKSVRTDKALRDR
jgi:hypothetical protein